MQKYRLLIGDLRFMQPPKHLKLSSVNALVQAHWRALAVASVLCVGGCTTTPDIHSTSPLEVSGPIEAGTPAQKTVVSELPVLSKATPFQCASQIPLHHRAGQLMFPLVTQPEFTQASDLAAKGLLGGVVVLGTPSEPIREDIAKFQTESLFGPAIVAVDEEGGRVQRLAAITSTVPSARTVARTLELPEARELASEHAAAIGELGFTMNLAPVADLNDSPAIGDRSFGGDPALVTEFALATANGIIDAGLVPVLKHFPGHGRASDSHHSLPIIPEVDVLKESDLVPFIEVVNRQDIPIMMGHLVVEGLTKGQPASVSAEAVDGLLRGELGFDGLVMTDAFNMEAISATMSNAEAAELAVAAGVDLVMLSSLGDASAALERIVAAVNKGRIEERSITESFLRVMSTRDIDVCELQKL